MPATQPLSVQRMNAAATGQALSPSQVAMGPQPAIPSNLAMNLPPGMQPQTGGQMPPQTGGQMPPATGGKGGGQAAQPYGQGNTMMVQNPNGGLPMPVLANDPRFQGMTPEQMSATVFGGSSAYGQGQGRPMAGPAQLSGADVAPAVMPGGQAIGQPMAGQAPQQQPFFGEGSPYMPGGNMFSQASDAISRGMQGAAHEMAYQPAMVQSYGYQPTAVTDPGGYKAMNVRGPQMGAAQVNQGDINRYMNPYTSSVVDQSMQDIERSRLMQANQAAAQAQAAGAFGGSRGALMEAEIARNAMDQASRTGSQLRSQGFSQAAQLAQEDAARRQQASMTNVNTGLQSQIANQAAQAQAAQFGLGQNLQAQLANQGAYNAAGQFGAAQNLQSQIANQGALLAGSSQRLAAGQQLANIGNLGFGQAQGIQQNMQQQGALQQALMQQLINAGRNQFQGYTGFPQQSLGYYTQALGASQIPQSQSTTSDPGIFGWASMLLGSDIRFKENIRPAGKTPEGHNLYMWDWNETAKDVLGEEGSAMGVIAQEVIETRPDLVVAFDDGYYRVNYGGIQ